MVTVSYRPELFEHVDLPDGSNVTIFLNIHSLPVKFGLNKNASVSILCTGTIKTVGPGGWWMETKPTGSFQFDVWGNTFQSLNGPLILEAADRLGIEVTHECAPECPHRK